jgi:hypothetical protein
VDLDEETCARCGHNLRAEAVYRTAYTREDLLALGLTPALVSFVFTEEKPRPFTNWCEPREAGWPCVCPADATAIYPLWTCNADVTTVCLRAGRLEFLELRHDDPEPTFLAATEQGLLARLFVPILESPSATPARLKTAAALVGFQHLDGLLRWHKRNGSRSDFAEQLNRFVRSIDEGKT